MFRGDYRYFAHHRPHPWETVGIFDRCETSIIFDNNSKLAASQRVPSYSFHDFVVKAYICIVKKNLALNRNPTPAYCGITETGTSKYYEPSVGRKSVGIGYTKNGISSSNRLAPSSSNWRQNTKLLN